MIGILLAIALTQQPTTCTVTNLAEPVRLHCSGVQDDLLIPSTEWPEQWPSPMLGFDFPVEQKNGDLAVLPLSKEQMKRYQQLQAEARARALSMQERRIPAQYQKP